jgi:hypothetical protein
MASCPFEKRKIVQNSLGIPSLQVLPPSMLKGAKYLLLREFVSINVIFDNMALAT